MPREEPLDPLIVSERIRSRYLIPGERVVVSTKRHWWRLSAPFALCGALFVLMIAGAFSPDWGQAAYLLVWAWVASLLWAIWRFLEWRTEWFIATDRRLLKTYGLITQKVAMMPLAKVTDMSYDRSILGRLLGYGEFVMESAGQDQALSKMDLVPGPERKYIAMCETMFGRDSDISDPTEDGPQWDSDGRYDEWSAEEPPHQIGDADWDEAGSRRGERGRGERGRGERGPGERGRGERGRDEGRNQGREPRWEQVHPDELPSDWEWIDDEPAVLAPGPRRRVAVDPDPTPWR
ncbi:PH domain-containing protein [Ornithinimicrobium sp. Y1694]|uniref:PH domain-containing protein n=1 Tax=Ornithinimicrobium sp. Y1694 TaxID=3418590 RepID=UPI003CF19469